MDKKRLAAIRERSGYMRDTAFVLWSANDIQTLCRVDVPELLAEVERLDRELFDWDMRLRTLERENTDLRAVLRRVTDSLDARQNYGDADALIADARALLGSDQ